MKKLLFIFLALTIFACSDDEGNPSVPEVPAIPQLLNCDGNPIPSIVYGTQEWTVENACHITYRDGTSIPEVTDNTEWANLTTGAWAYYNNDPTKPRLYNWYAVAGVHDTNINTPNKEFAPEGWRVPGITFPTADFQILENHLIANGYNYDGTIDVNKIGKSMASETGWNSSTQPGAVGNDQSLNNSSGFNAFPEGFRLGYFQSGTDDVTDLYGTFRDEGNFVFFWGDFVRATRTLIHNMPLFYHFGSTDTNGERPSWGFSVRLIRD